MSEQLIYSFTVQVTDGPKLSESRELGPDGYDKLAVTIPADPADAVEVVIVPDDTETIDLLLIKASSYEALVYRVNEVAVDRSLNGPLLLIGSGAVGYLDTTPKKLTFSNTTDEDVTVDILVGRDATL